MKKLSLLGILSIAALGLGAQNKENDTLKIRWKDSRIWIFDATPAAKSDSASKVPHVPGKKEFIHWGGLDLGVSMLTTIDNKVKLSDDLDTNDMNNFLNLDYGKSIFISLNLLEKNFRLYKNYINLVTGLGMEWNSYNFKKNITLNPDAPYIASSNSTFTPDSIKFSKNKLKVAYLKMPLLIELNTNSENPRRSFHISGGLEFAYKIGSRTKQKYEINGYDFKSSRRADYHLADFKYSSVIRVGYGDHVTLFANYGLSELFEANKTADDMDLFPLTTGISIDF